jgi:cardiolipin synthase
MLKNIPNALTIVRFVLIPFIVYYILTGQYIAGFVMLTVSGLTDILDGCIARKFNFITNFGKLIDPLADKATQIAVLASLTFKGIVPLWILLIVFIKEIVMVAGASFLYGKKLVVSSRWYGKLATVLFYVAIVCSLFIEYWNTTINPSTPLFGFDDYIYYLAIATTVFSLIMYFKQFYQEGYLKKENLKIEN